MGSPLPEVEKDLSPALLQSLQVLLSSQDRESAHTANPSQGLAQFSPSVHTAITCLTMLSRGPS